MSVAYQIGSALDVGLKRKGKTNQDAIRMALPGWFNRRPPLLVLSDGMGAYGGGEVASRLAVDTLSKFYRRRKIVQDGYLDVLKSGIGVVHQVITRKARCHKGLEWMGCTIVAAILTEEEIHLANVGDSRAYLIKPDKIELISHDHSLVAEQVRLGLITELEARSHPRRNVLSLSLTGRRENAPPYLASLPWTDEDTLLLCSDGLWGPVTEAQIHSVVLELEPQKAADKLVQLANTHGGPDNISVIIARCAGVQFARHSKSDDTNPGF